MPVFKYCVFVWMLLVPFAGTMAQKPKPVRPKVTPTAKPVFPKLKTSLGSRSDSVVLVPVDEVVQLITLPLTITDDKKTAYTISSYQCMYKRLAVTEDEESGKVSPVKSIVAEFFRTTPLSEIWKKTITEQLKPGEEIYFFDVVVKDAKGRLMLAPNIKILVQ